MSADRSADASSPLVGRQGEPFELVIELGKIREFARATKANDPEYWEGPEPVVPPTFLTTAAQWAPADMKELLESTGWDVQRMLHAEQEYLFPGGVPRAGTSLRASTRIKSTYERTGRRAGLLRFLVLETDFRDAAGEIFAVSRTTVVETAQVPESGEHGDRRD
jgi:hypothetical protein